MEEQNKQANPASGETSPQQPQGDAKDIQENKLVALLSYIGILFLVPLLLKKDSKFSQFHAKQGLVVFLGEIAGFLTVGLLGLGLLVYIAMVILSIIGIINVLNGKMEKLPVIGDWADKFNL